MFRMRPTPNLSTMSNNYVMHHVNIPAACCHGADGQRGTEPDQQLTRVRQNMAANCKDIL